MKKKLFLFLIALFLINFISASWDWDNSKNYDENTRTATIKNSFGLGGKVADVSLISSPVNYVIRGKDRLVAEFEIINYEDYDDVFNQLDFYDLNDESLKIDRAFVYKYKIVKGMRKIPYYTQKCETCEKKIDHYNYEEIVEWKILDDKKQLPRGNITLGIFTDVYAGDHVEWIPTLYGVKIDEWAEWTDSLNTGLVHYFNFNETSGTNAEDQRGGDLNYVKQTNATLDTGQEFVSDSILGYALNFTDPSQRLGANLSDEAEWDSLLDGGHNLTISFWAKSPTAQTHTIFGKGYISDQFYIRYSTANDIQLDMKSDGGGELGVHSTGDDLLDDAWNHIVIVYNGTKDDTQVLIFVNNVSVSLTAFVDTLTGVVDNNDSATFGGGCYSSCSDSSFMNGTIDEFGVWNRTLSALEVSQLYNNGNGISYDQYAASASLSVILGIPSNNTQTILSSLYFNSSFSGVNVKNFSNSTLYLWYNNGSVYETNTSTVDNILNSSNLSLALPISDNLFWNYDVCGFNLSDDVVCAYSLLNRTISRKSFVLNSQVFNTTANETSRETFTANISQIGGEILTARFYYDGINQGYATREEVGSETIFTKTIDIPITDGSEQNKTFFWSINYGGINSNTSNYGQNVSIIQIGLCNSTIPIESLNFTLADEGTQAILTITDTTEIDYEATFNYWIGGGSTYKNFSYSLLSSNVTANFTFCVDHNETQASMSSQYGANGYSDRVYNLNNASLTDLTSHIKLFLLNESDAVKFTITVKEGVSTLEGALITVSKFFVGDGVYKTISIRESDNLGQFIEYLELDKDYRYAVVYDGVLRAVIDKKSSCLASPCELTLQIDSAQGNIWSPYSDYYAGNILSNLTFNASTEVVTYNFIDITGLANYFRLQVDQVRYNSSVNTICDTYSYTSSGTITCNVSGNYGDFLAKTYVSRSPEKVDKVLTFLISEIKENLGLLMIFISIMIIISMCIAGAVISGGNPSTIAFMFGASIFGLKLMAMLPFSWGVIGLVELLVIVLIAKLGT